MLTRPGEGTELNRCVCAYAGEMNVGGLDVKKKTLVAAVM